MDCEIAAHILILSLSQHHPSLRSREPVQTKETLGYNYIYVKEASRTREPSLITGGNLSGAAPAVLDGGYVGKILPVTYRPVVGDMRRNASGWPRHDIKTICALRRLDA
jgi:hypothetical protein